VSHSLAALLAIRDRKDRTIGYELSSAPSFEVDTVRAADDNARASLALVSTFARLTGKSLLVPVTPALVRDGTLARFASMDVVMLVATESTDDPATRRAMERLMSSGIRFALDGYPESDPLPPFLSGVIVALSAHRKSSDALHMQLRTLVDAGLRPLVRGVDDRATRLRVLQQGAALHSGRLLSRAASVNVDPEMRASIVRAIDVLANLADGRPPGAEFDRYINDDARISAALLKSVGSAAIGVRNPRSVPHAVALLGRDAVLESLAVATARLIGELAQDTELSMTAMVRVHLCERLGAALDPAPHPRARVAAALLSVVEYAFAEPPAVMLDNHFNALPPVFADAMLARRGPLGQLLDLVEALENGWWSDLRERCQLLGISTAVVAEAYQDAWRQARDDLATTRVDS
jgi:c-di-GMP-related signal transduction protein